MANIFFPEDGDVPEFDPVTGQPIKSAEDLKLYKERIKTQSNGMSPVQGRANRSAEQKRGVPWYILFAPTQQTPGIGESEPAPVDNSYNGTSRRATNKYAGETKGVNGKEYVTPKADIATLAEKSPGAKPAVEAEKLAATTKPVTTEKGLGLGKELKSTGSFLKANKWTVGTMAGVGFATGYTIESGMQMATKTGTESDAVKAGASGAVDSLAEGAKSLIPLRDAAICLGEAGDAFAAGDVMGVAGGVLGAIGNLAVDATWLVGGPLGRAGGAALKIGAKVAGKSIMTALAKGIGKEAAIGLASRAAKAAPRVPNLLSPNSMRNVRRFGYTYAGASVGKGVYDNSEVLTLGAETLATKAGVYSQDALKQDALGYAQKKYAGVAGLKEEHATISNKQNMLGVEPHGSFYEGLKGLSASMTMGFSGMMDKMSGMKSPSSGFSNLLGFGLNMSPRPR